MKQVIAVGLLVIAVVGCVWQSDIANKRDVGKRGAACRIAKNVHLRSVLGINDAVLADTNRFVLGGCRYFQEFKLDRPWGEFSDVHICLDEMARDLRERTVAGKPHRLRSVTLIRRLPPNVTTEETLVVEFQKACDFVAGILGVEPLKARLIDMAEWRRRMERHHRMMERHHLIMYDLHPQSHATFELADKQRIVVRLTEAAYTVRDGNVVMSNPGYVEVDLIFNHRLYHTCRTDKINADIDTDRTAGVTEIDLGPDCCEKLSEALKPSS